MTLTGQEIAVIGLACRFPGAGNAAEFWANLVGGVESITALSVADLRAAGVARSTRNQPDYVRATPLLDGYDQFDAPFFGYSPREAVLLDPQHRVFLECAWAATEDAGYDTSRYPGSIGVYAGAALNSYLLHSGVAARLRDDYLLTLTANDKDFLATRASYQLNLDGPSVTIQTACSTSLVAVHVACQALLAGECDVALAGGVSVRVPQQAGYQYEPDGVLSPNGQCRAFDAKAAGTLFGSGVGVVVLKPLADALADGDRVRVVIKGSAVNNDGATKVNYAAPSVVGQAEVVAEALAYADVDPATVSYVEAHGTGTALGDPIEIAALTKAFRRGTQRSGFCAIGSVKTNVGHLDAAAGIAGLIKTVLALEHAMLPPSLHFREPNPEIDFAATPFYVNSVLSSWPDSPGPRRAGVSSLGIGGTNAHVVLEQAPTRPPSGPSRPYQLLVLSARTLSALNTATANLRARLATEPDLDLADVAYTLQMGRKAFAHRRTLVCRDLADAVAALREPYSLGVRTGRSIPRSRPVVFLLPGGGSKPPRIAEVYTAEPVFRDRLDHGLAELRALGGPDLTGLLLSRDDPAAGFDRPLRQLPALFLVEDALAALWMSWGVRPSALIGHSLGELTAACVAGVLDFADAIGAVLTRAQLVESTAKGSMLSVELPEHQLLALLGDRLDLAAVNTPGSCVASGPVDAITELAVKLADLGIASANVPIDRAGHSRLLDPIVAPFEKYFTGVRLAAPSIPFVSNLTGDWITDDQATDPAYWAAQLRGTVRFADGAAMLLGHPDRVFLEVGPGRILSTFIRSRPDRASGHLVLPALAASEPGAEVAATLDCLGHLWQAGVDIDWVGFSARQRRYRVSLPTYPFERQRHWFGASGSADSRVVARVRTAVRRGVAVAGAAIGRWRTRSTSVAAPTAGFVAPRTATERAIAEIWRNVLGVRELSVHDDFFELGGSSLLVTEVIRRVNERYRIELSLLTLIESPTVAGLAECVAAVRMTHSDR